MHTKSIDYIYYSHAKKTYQVFISGGGLGNLLTKNHDIVISDHAAVHCITIPSSTILKIQHVPIDLQYILYGMHLRPI